MSDEQRSADALLATACSHLLHAGEMAHQMRNLQRDGKDYLYWQTAEALAQQLLIAGHCLTESHTILLARTGLQSALPMSGGLPN